MADFIINGKEFSMRQACLRTAVPHEFPWGCV